jgi:hypothetical protein
MEYRFKKNQDLAPENSGQNECQKNKYAGYKFHAVYTKLLSESRY